ncbi:hypothetical protein EXT48_22800 [Pseudoalteromonas sp. CO348]|uniref:hypothetical protein n=1 Tax=unclassified Pseudoalteromonas TaxID=194690 RepID=UPI0010239D2E|nr:MULTISPECIES: hypothetical protein [unclassified Pseudoalteromonas]MCG7542095.1 hypothetical protein [Pseudoalteromonas sp. OF7H-1]RZF98290.1 hypothetical protein EXT48_22800 [Pseudoalteromonas sp. CO348]
MGRAYNFSKVNIHKAIENAYAAGYRLGISDGREGIMVSPKEVSKIYVKEELRNSQNVRQA